MPAQPGLANPAIPASEAKVSPREVSALAASSIAWGIVRKAILAALRLGLTNAYQSRAAAPRLVAWLALTARARRGIIATMPLIETEEAARRLARAIASDLSLYNEDKIVGGIQNDNLFESLAEEIEEGRALYKRRVSPELYPRNFYDRALVDILIKAKGHIKSKLW
jgi:hypothetical protein